MRMASTGALQNFCAGPEPFGPEWVVRAEAPYLPPHGPLPTTRLWRVFLFTSVRAPVSASSWDRHSARREASMNEGEPRELSLDEVDDLSMQAIDQIEARHPVREYRTPKAE